MKYVLIFDMALITGISYIFFTYQMIILFMIPVLIALLYMNMRVLWFAEIVSMVALIVSHIVSSAYVAQPWLEIFTDISDIFRFYLVPRILQACACFVIVNVLVNRVIRYFREYDRILAESSGNVMQEDKNVDADLHNFISILNTLTESEQKVFMQLLQGKTNSQIA